MSPLISVIIPAYNAGKTIVKCVESVLNQTIQNIQIVIIDDGSTDDTFEICQELSRNHNRITFYSKTNSGVSNSRNIGIKLSKGKYIGFVDSDDYIEETMYEELLNTLTSCDASVATLVNYTIKKSGIKPSSKSVTSDVAENLLCMLKFPTSVWAYLYNAEILEGIQFNEDIHFFEDFLFNYYVISRIGSICLSESLAYHYTANENSANAAPLNSKKLSSLCIENYLRDDTKTKKYFCSFLKHCVVSLILSSTNRNSEMKSIEVLQTVCKKNVKRFLHKDKISLCSIIICLYSISPPTVIFILKIFKRVKRLKYAK